VMNSMRATLAALRDLDVVHQVGSVIQVLASEENDS
jgi:hypothetical protein